jgi:hypothetical protein
VFAPIFSVPLLGTINYFQNGKGDGVIVLVLAIVSVALALVKLYKGLLLTGGGTIAILVFTLFNFQSKMSDLQSSMEKELAGNPFAGFGQAVLNSIQLEWGWAVLIIGACLVIAAPFVREESTAAKVDPVQDAQGSATEPTPVPEETLPIDMEKLQAFARAPMPVPVALKPDKSLVRVGVVVGIVLLVLVGILAAFQFTHSPASIVGGPATATTASTPTASYVRPQPQPTAGDAPNRELDAGLANSLSEELQHTLSTAKINVAVENGRTTLTGTVDTVADREEAARIAEARPSVRVLINSLAVQAAARPTADIPIPATVVDSSHESTVDRSDATTSKELNAAGLRLLSARQSDFSEAKRTFEKAVQLDSSNIEALNNLGYVYSRIGDYRSAEATLLKVLAVAPTRRAAHGNLGYVEAKLGKTQEAVKHYCQYMQQFDSLERGKSALVHANAADPDPNVQAAIEATVANCTR